MPGNNAVPVIIKRKKIVAAAGHHGGAWKVAYADFVTAMMAFFMLMWLVGATTEEQRKGIADYFNITVPLNPISGGGADTFSGESVFSADVMARTGRGAAVDLTAEENRARGAEGEGEGSTGSEADANAAALEALEAALAGTGGESIASDLLLQHVVTRQTDEGLVIELHDLPGATLFVGDSAKPTPLMRALVGELSPLVGLVNNQIALGGHVAARPVIAVGVDAWTSSIARAAETRRLVTAAGTDGDRIARVTGHGDREPVTVNGMAARNARVEIVLLRSKF